MLIVMQPRTCEENIQKEFHRQEIEEKISKVDVVIATPPCQGMSVANHKKTNTEIIRNSLVIESIKLIKDINTFSKEREHAK